MPKDDDDEIILPKAKKPASKGKSSSSSASKGPSPQMARLMLGTRVVAMLFGGFVTTVGFMSVVGFVSDNVWARLVVALVFVIGIPSFVADRLLRRKLLGGLPMVADVFAIVLLGFALLFVAADVVTKGMFAKEGDRYARSGSRTMARVVYYVAGVAPVFPEEKEAGKGAASASASGAPKGSSR